MEHINPEDKLNELSIKRDSHAEDMVDHYWGSINYITSLIKASELKAGLILSFYGILLNFIFKSVETLFAGKSIDVILYVLAGFWFCVTASSIFYCIQCFIPRIEGKFDKNILFFGDVISKFGSVKDFSKTFYEVSLDEERLFQQMGEQIFVISKISAWKFENVKWAIRLLGIQLLLLLIIVFYYLVSTI
ncbi:Pycsar system effector family protein [Portibacter lacus]|uniref:Pycsar effector protein domain-containing protein n=1 Tax=Portibacter lacus TaxID=1099794 RepID=A0AA37SWA2_9BACT|nr:Pycsar system effector family protein [Portibacter lacus]GLR19128.1 hypothetical protein GCM10007940_37440 [Portibacter lacus]